MDALNHAKETVKSTDRCIVRNYMRMASIQEDMNQKPQGFRRSGLQLDAIVPKTSTVTDDEEGGLHSPMHSPLSFQSQRGKKRGDKEFLSPSSAASSRRSNRPKFIRKKNLVSQKLVSVQVMHPVH